MPQDIGRVVLRDAYVDDLGHDQRDEELQNRLEALERGCQEALEVVALEVAPKSKHVTP